MKTTILRNKKQLLALPAIAMAFGFAAAGCGDNGQKDASNTPASPGAQTSGASTTPGALNGAGATFPAPLYQKWFQEYQAKNGVQINYQAIGSGGGIKGITAKSVDFGASDAPMNDEEMAKAPGILHVPTVAGAVAMAYNVPGVPTGVHLTGDIIADIFLGKITKWNDARITALNPGKNFPALTIAPVHRADGSGTTNIFTTYLSQVSPTWKAAPGAGKSVKWSAGVAGKGNAGVGALVQQTQGAIGYIELAYAVQNKLTYADIQNAKGAFITPSIDSTTDAAAGVTLPDDFRQVITNTSDPKGYPITGFTFLLVYKTSKPDVKKFLQWALTDGQKDAPSLMYAPLPASVQKKAMAEVDTIQ